MSATERPVTVFDKEQWPLMPDPLGPRMYGPLTNVLTVPLRGKVLSVALAVPAELFSFMREVLGIEASDEAHLAMDMVDGFYVLSLFYVKGGEDNLADLWSYTPKTVPSWMFQPSNWLKQTQT